MPSMTGMLESYLQRKGFRGKCMQCPGMCQDVTIGRDGRTTARRREYVEVVGAKERAWMGGNGMYKTTKWKGRSLERPSRRIVAE